MPVEYENNLILVEKRMNCVAVVTLNNPPMNVNSIDSMKELTEAFRRLEKDPEARVVVLTGAGSRAFNVGTDLTGMKSMRGNFKAEKFNMEMAMMDSIEFFPRPTICAIEGYCLGGGLELACTCDIRIVSEKAKLGQPEITLGVFPAAGGLYRLPRLVGLPQALEIMYLGTPVDAQEAYRLGLANRIVPPGSALEAAVEMAEKIAKMPPNALAVIKEGSRKMWQKESKDNLYTNLEYIDRIFDHYNGVEGIEAFLEKRKPNFCYDI